MDRAYKALNIIAEVARKQAKDEGLWFDAQTAAEAFLQKALREMHSVAENALMGAAMADVLYPLEKQDE